MSLAESFYNTLRDLEPNITGALSVTHDKHGELRIIGTLNSPVAVRPLLLQVVEALHLPAPTLIAVQSSDLSVAMTTSSGISTYPPHGVDRDHQWSKVLYQGNLPTSAITAPTPFKHTNQQARRKVGNVVMELGVIAPLVLDQHLQVVDGATRLSIAQELGMSEVPVIVHDLTQAEANLLRLTLNRSSEFQLWDHLEAADFVDSLPQLQPLLEPLGFFGTRVLPVSYFSRNLINYEVDGETSQQKYSQEVGLEEWARIQRDRIRQQEAIALDEPLMRRHLAPRLFDLPTPEESDFLATYDAEEELEAFEADLRELAFRVDRNSKRLGG